jgi:hypothetical protein
MLGVALLSNDKAASVNITPPGGRRRIALIPRAKFEECCCPPPESCVNIYLDSYSVSNFVYDVGAGWFEKLRIPATVVVNRVTSGATPCEWFRFVIAPAGSEFWTGSAWVAFTGTVAYDLKLVTTPVPVWRLTANAGAASAIMEKSVGQYPMGLYREPAVGKATVS